MRADEGLRGHRRRKDDNSTVPRMFNKAKAEVSPEILILDVDGVLVDVRQTYWRSAIETVRHLTGKRVTHAELHRWKSKPGNNDDWQMVASWSTELGYPTSYQEAQAAFGEFYWGTDGRPAPEPAPLCRARGRGGAVRARLRRSPTFPARRQVV